MELAAIITGVAALIASFGWLVFRSWLRQEMRARQIRRVEEESRPRYKRDLPEATADAAIEAPRQQAGAVGSGFGLVHLGVIGKRDPLFVEGEFIAWIHEAYGAAQLDRSEGGHPLSPAAYDVLRGGPFGGRRVDRVVVGRPQLKGAYADELWANVELLFEAWVLEEGVPIWRRDTWQLRRKATQDWVVAAISVSNRYDVIPQPEVLPFGALEPGVHAAVDLDMTWADFKTDNDVDALKEQICELVYDTLRGTPELEGALRWHAELDAVLLDGVGLERMVRVERVEVRTPLRHQRDRRDERVDFRVSVMLRAWLQKPDEELPPPEEARTVGARVTVVRDLDGSAWRLDDLRWMPVMEST